MVEWGHRKIPRQSRK